MTLAFSSKHPYVPTPEQGRWIASLSDGSTVFQDITPHESSAWTRLRRYVELHGLKVTNLRLEAYGRRVMLIPYQDDEDRPQLNGYWQASKMGAFLNANVVDAQGQPIEPQWRGIGYIKNTEIIITWVDNDGNVTQEVRPLFTVNDNGERNFDFGIIMNDQIV